MREAQPHIIMEHVEGSRCIQSNKGGMVGLSKEQKLTEGIF